MVYKKFLVVASKQDEAGINITTSLSQFQENPLLNTLKDKPSFDFYLIENEIVETKNLDLEKINKYDFIIFASRHKSEKNEKSICIHAPGNFRETRLGGEDGKLSMTSALFMKQTFGKLNKIANENNLKNYKVTMEVTHHGPLINKPCMFIEIGSTILEWKDKKVAFVIARTLSEIIEGFKENPYNEVAIGIGGGHYCPIFNKLQLNSNIAFSHIIPKYALPLTKEMIMQAISNTDEEVDFVVLDFNGLGNKEIRDEVIKILEDNYIAWKKAHEITR